MNPIVSMILGVLLYALYFVNGYMNAPMTIPEAKQYTPGISFNQLWQDRQAQFEKVDARNKSKYNCAGWTVSRLFAPIFGTPLIGYAAIHREFIKDVPSSSRVDIAPEGMFPDPDHANWGDYINSYWYSFQKMYWWLEVDHIAPDGCEIPHPSQTMKDEIKAAKARK